MFDEQFNHFRLMHRVDEGGERRRAFRRPQQGRAEDDAQVGGGHVVGLLLRGHSPQVVHQKGQGGVVVSREFVHQFVELLQTGRRGVGRRTRPLSSHADEIRVKSRRQQRFRQLAQVKFQHVGHHVRVNIRQIDQIGAILKRLAQFFHFGLDARHSIQSLFK